LNLQQHRYQNFKPRKQGVTTGNPEHHIYCITRNLMTCNHHKNYSGNQIEKNEMGGACSTYGGKERCIEDFGGET
jgi:hypothetical protein